jgi:hypothetical protein
MTKQEVLQIMGVPDSRSFRETNEAWQYQEVAGFGQCSYLTLWMSNGRLVATTNRTGSSVAGCGLGAREVDWGQMPRPSLDLNINTRKN